MKYLVTGGAGFIGSHLVDKLIEQNHKVVVIDNLSIGKKENINPKAIFHQIDICDFEKIKPYFQEIDYVFHLAAIPRVQLSIQDPVGTSKVNILGTINVFGAAIDAKVKKIIFISSAAVYGDSKKLLLKENTEVKPISPYGLHKLVGEQTAKLFANLYKIPIISLRYFNVYGPRIDFDSDYGLVVGKFLFLSAQKKPLTIFGDGKQTRGFCYIDDVVDASLKTITSNKLKGGEIINISTDKSYSVSYLAKLIGGEIQYLSKRVGDPLHVQADITLAKNLLSWKPKISFEKGIKKTKQWFQEKYRNNKLLI